MKARLRDYLELVRIPNAFTAVADVLAGFFFAGGMHSDALALVVLAAASACIYSGGVALNDVLDVEWDLGERPERPIPSGRVTPRAGRWLAYSLLAVGVVLAGSISSRTRLPVALLVVSIVLYDGFMKTTVMGPGLMGLCRALNLALGMSLAPALWTTSHAFALALMWLYVTSVTVFARQEAGESSRGWLSAATLGLCLAVAGLAGLRLVVAEVHEEYLILVAVLLLLLGYRGFRAAVQPHPSRVQQAVKIFVVSLVMFDACLAWSARGLMAALLVAVVLVPVMVLGRRFRVT